MSENPWFTAVSIIILLILFFGGGFVGEQLALALAPSSGLSRLLGFLALPAAFIAGFVLWAGTATVVLIARLAKRGSPTGRKASEIPPGAIGFLWSSVLSCLIVGALTGLLSEKQAFFPVFGSFAATGLVYGILCWQLAKSGWLPFPRE